MCRGVGSIWGNNGPLERSLDRAAPTVSVFRTIYLLSLGTSVPRNIYRELSQSIDLDLDCQEVVCVLH